jgi:hypothetical protein
VRVPRPGLAGPDAVGGLELPVVELTLSCCAIRVNAFGSLNGYLFRLLLLPNEFRKGWGPLGLDPLLEARLLARLDLPLLPPPNNPQ